MLSNIIKDLIHFFCNYIVANIPFWFIRKFAYRLCGMKIGKNSRILMKTYILNPWKISIGNGTYINEFCTIDGRGYLTIGNNVSISMHTIIITGTHDSKSSSFNFVTFPVIIEDNVWVGVNAVILPGVIMKRKSVLAAGSVMIYSKSPYEENTIYSGIPCKKIKDRSLESEYSLGNWKPLLR